jgi:nitrate/nitrite-specific signal transduction histidine kinase
MQEDQFTKLFKYIESFRKEVNNKLDEKASQASIDKLINTIDGFVKRLDEVESEQLARDAQFGRLLAWAREVSKKTGIPLKEL